MTKPFPSPSPLPTYRLPALNNLPVPKASSTSSINRTGAQKLVVPYDGTSTCWTPTSDEIYQIAETSLVDIIRNITQAEIEAVDDTISRGSHHHMQRLQAH